MGKRTRNMLMNRLKAFSTSCPWGPLNPCDPCNDKPSAQAKAEFAEKVLKLMSAPAAAPAQVTASAPAQGTGSYFPFFGR